MRLLLRPAFLCLLLTRSAACTVVLGTCLSLTARVHAEPTLDDERAHAHFVSGESHFAAERWADASREFSLAYEMSRRPEMLINLSRAHERDGQLSAAITDLELLLSLHPESAYRGEAEQRMTVMRAKLATQPAPPAPVVAPVSTELPAVADTSSATPEPSPLETAAPAPEKPNMWPSWTTMAVGGAGVVAGVVALGTGLRAHSIYQGLESRCGSSFTCNESFASDRDRGRALARASTALTFATVALVGSAAVLWVYDVKRRDRAIAFGVDGPGARFRAEF